MSETTIAEVSGAPAMIEVGEGKERRTLRMSPLRLKEMGMWERFVHARMSEAARGIAADVGMAEELVKRISQIGWFADESTAVLRTIEGQLYATWLGIQIEEPTVSLDWYTTHLQKFDQLNTAVGLFSELNFKRNSERSDESKKVAEPASVSP